MDIAQRVAQMSHAVRLQVGSVLVKDDNIVSYGWNGMPSGWDNNCEYIEFMDNSAGGWLSLEEIVEKWPFEGKFWINGTEINTRYRLKTKPEVLHAESNCLMKIAKNTTSSKDATMYCTHAPCLQCSKLILQAGVQKLYYRNTYREHDGVEFLLKSGIDVEHYQDV